jgi:serine/threonine-protein kinase HipA
MRIAEVSQNAVLAGILEERENGFRFTYDPQFKGEPVSLAMPRGKAVWEFSAFPPAFEGLLPEGARLEALLRRRKLDKSDLFGQLMAVGSDVVGSLSFKEVP